MLNNEEYRENYDAVMAELCRLDVNHPARLAFGKLCNDQAELLERVEELTGC